MLCLRAREFNDRLVSAFKCHDENREALDAGVSQRKGFSACERGDEPVAHLVYL